MSSTLGGSDYVPLFNRTYQLRGDQLIRGTYLPAFVNNGGHYFARDIEIYEDGSIVVEGEARDVEGLRRWVHRGYVTTHVPEGTTVSYGLFMAFVDAHVRSMVDEDDFIREVEDEIRFLNNQPTTSDLCREALESYRANPTEQGREELRRAYEAVPRHLRVFLGPMGIADGEYRVVLGLEP